MGLFYKKVCAILVIVITQIMEKIMPVRRIQRDHSAYREKIKQIIKENLWHYMEHGELIGRRGKNLVSIPVRRIKDPMFRFASPRRVVGAGKGKKGTPVFIDPESDEEIGSGAGNAPGWHPLEEIEFVLSLDELADILGMDLGLPRMKPGGKKIITAKRDFYRGVRKSGPRALTLRNHMLRHARLRAIMLNPPSSFFGGEDETEDEENVFPFLQPPFFYQSPLLVINPYEDIRSWSVLEEKTSSAVIIYIMDVSGSMEEKQKELARYTSFWINLWLNHKYPGLDEHYVIHDAVAREIDRETFFRIRTSGGTIISSGYKKAVEITERKIQEGFVNFYFIHFSDGDNWSESDDEECMRILRDKIFAKEFMGVERPCNQFAYLQTKSRYGSGHFLNVIEKEFSEEERLVTYELETAQDIRGAVQAVLTKNK